MSAEAHGRIGRITLALQQIHEAFQGMYATSQRWDEAEMHRVHGDLLLRDGDREGATAAFRRALAIAQQQHAGLWELRAACDLARLDAERGERGLALDMLSPVCAKFDSQSASADFRSARALLDALR
jgi:predicted ATPase